MPYHMFSGLGHGCHGTFRLRGGEVKNIARRIQRPSEPLQQTVTPAACFGLGVYIKPRRWVGTEEPSPVGLLDAAAHPDFYHLGASQQGTAKHGRRMEPLDRGVRWYRWQRDSDPVDSCWVKGTGLRGGTAISCHLLVS